MALVHEKLYQSPDLARVDFAEYIRNLTTYLFRAYSAHAHDIILDIQTDDVFLGIDTAVPCGLILNELISNALKHAFPNGRKGKIRVEFRAGEGARADGGGMLALTVDDDGVGLPEGFDFQDTPSLGLRLVNSLVDQLDGRIETHNHGGTQVRITFDD
jgi:two-component sensor histidine kinase